ncbi:MAG: hypothetical protein CMF55_03780 [Legionellales bacterium]|jgi:hypothetical protein|nr:hypothetical protein [Legionellales bacterium]|tara:strand:- start:8226 stop:8531 length:306 start_codon:yes stop_codon:yes gene_type:complete
MNEEKNYKRMLKETENWINKRVMSENIILRGELPKVNVYLSMMGVKGNMLRVVNGYQQTLDGGGFAAFDVAVNPVAFVKYGTAAPEIIGNEAIEKYKKLTQ